jgi:hypothetical protein
VGWGRVPAAADLGLAGAGAPRSVQVEAAAAIGPFLVVRGGRWRWRHTRGGAVYIRRRRGGLGEEGRGRKRGGDGGAHEARREERREPGLWTGAH